MMLFEFKCQGHRFAVPLSCVQRVVPSAWLTPLPGAPAVVLGVLIVDGEAVTVLDFSSRAALPSVDIGLAHQLILTRIDTLSIGLLVDETVGILKWQQNGSLPTPNSLAAAAFVQGLLRIENGLCIVLDPERFLLEEERSSLDRALREFHHAIE
jgi:chemotaxis signal transduction protein